MSFGEPLNSTSGFRFHIPLTRRLYMLELASLHRPTMFNFFPAFSPFHVAPPSRNELGTSTLAFHFEVFLSSPSFRLPSSLDCDLWRN